MKNLALILPVLIFGFNSLFSAINPMNDEFRDSTSVDEVEVVAMPENFDYVYDRFKVFNPDLDTSTVITFIDVCDAFDLDTTDKLREWFVGQILQESGAKQYYHSTHPKAGQLVKSSGGAIGICQITTRTAYGNLSKYVTTEDREMMYDLGCTSIDFIDSTLTYNQKYKMTSKWLENETNNLVLWGFIMNRKFENNFGILKALVSYNAGTGGMQEYVRNGGSLSKHHYVVNIKNKLKTAESKL